MQKYYLMRNINTPIAVITDVSQMEIALKEHCVANFVRITFMSESMYIANIDGHTFPISIQEIPVYTSLGKD